MKRRLYLCQLKMTIGYKGPDPFKQEAAVYWLARTLGYWVHGPHRKIIRHQNITAFGERDTDMTLGFRGLGKSTVGTIVRDTKYIIDDFNVRILFASDSEAASVRFLREVRSHLQNNQDLTDIYGEFFKRVRGTDLGKYREGFATITQRTNVNISEPTVHCLGMGGQAASYHFDVIILDEMPHTKTHYMGTRYFPMDLYQVLEEGDKENGHGTGVLAGATLKIPAIVKQDGSDEEFSNYPQRYSLETLKRMERKMGKYHFNAQMQQDTRSGEGIIFKYSDFMWYNRDESFPDVPKLAIYQFFDLTGKKTDAGAFFAGVTIGVDKETKRIYVLDLVHFRGGMSMQRKAILDAGHKWNPVRSGIEAVQMQAGFAEEIQENTFLPIEPIPVEGDKVFRAFRVAHLVETGKVYFPMDPLPEAGICEPLTLELSTFPDGDFVDCVDAFVGALTLAILGGPKASQAEDDEEEDTGLRANYS